MPERHNSRGFSRIFAYNARTRVPDDARILHFLRLTTRICTRQITRGGHMQCASSTPVYVYTCFVLLILNSPLST